jgi:glycosyltransferase involved in cell wall biosynthesis
VYDAAYPYHKGGGERRFYEMAHELARQGLHVDLYCMQYWDGPQTLALAEGVEAHGLCRVRPLYTGSGRRAILPAVVFGVACVKLLRRRFDVIDCSGFPFFSLFTCRVVATVKRRPLLSTWHEVWGPRYWRGYLGPVGGRVGALVERLAVRLPDEIVAVSETTAARLRDELHHPRPIRVVPNGFDPAAVRVAAPAATTVDVVFAGRLIPDKNVDLLLRALGLLHERGRPVRCLVVGDGPERARLEALSASLGVAPHVRFAGALPDHGAVYGAIKSASVLVLPSSREGFAMVALEANACGVPVLTIEHPCNAARDLVHDQRNGWIVPPTSERLAAGIARALDGPRLTEVTAHVDGFAWSEIVARCEVATLYSRVRPPRPRRADRRAPSRVAVPC